MGRNSIRINAETVRAALLEWLNEGQYSPGLVIQGLQRHTDGSMTIIFEPPEPALAKKPAPKLQANGKPWDYTPGAVNVMEVA
jgi:hypothetical protein